MKEEHPECFYGHRDVENMFPTGFAASCTLGSMTSSTMKIQQQSFFIKKSGSEKYPESKILLVEKWPPPLTKSRHNTFLSFTFRACFWVYNWRKWLGNHVCDIAVSIKTLWECSTFIFGKSIFGNFWTLKNFHYQILLIKKDSPLTKWRHNTLHLLGKHATFKVTVLRCQEELFGPPRHSIIGITCPHDFPAIFIGREQD